MTQQEIESLAAIIMAPMAMFVFCIYVFIVDQKMIRQEEEEEYQE